MNFFSIPISLFAGLLSFLSPCVLPLVPSYLAYISGEASKEIKAGKANTKKVFVSSLFFSLGFTLIFTFTGLFFEQVENILGGYAEWFTIIAGIAIIIFGLNIMFNFISFLNRELKFYPSRSITGNLGSFIFGASFGLGWTPCVGPMLALIFGLASSSDTKGLAIYLLLAYSFGLSIPFIVMSLFFEKITPITDFIKKNAFIVKIISGLLLIVIGSSLFFGGTRNLSSLFYSIANGLIDLNTTYPMLINCIFAIPLVIISFLILFIVVKKRNTLPKMKTFFLLCTFCIFLILTILQIVGLLNVEFIFINWFQFVGI